MRRSRNKFCHPRRLRALRLEPLERRHLLAAAGVVGTVIEDSTGDFYTVDIRDGMAIERVGATDEVFFDIAFSPTGELFGLGGPLSGPSELYQIQLDLANPTEHIPTEFIGTVQVAVGQPVNLNALEFRSDGTLFGAGFDLAGNNFIYSIDVGTAAATEEVSTGDHGSAGDLVFAEDGNMYVTTDTWELLQIDPGLTSVSVVGAIDFNDFFGLTYGPGPEMYGFRNERQVWYINRDDASLVPIAVLDHPQLDFVWGAANLYHPPTDLGEVDFAERTGEQPIVGELWYRIEPAHDAFLTVDLPGVDPAADIDLALYRRNPDGTLDTLQTGTRRLDYESAEAGAVYFVQIDGAESPLDVRFTNLVEPVANGVMVHGTDGNDDFEFAKESPYRFSINGVEYQFGFNPSFDVDITFNGGLGEDSARLVGSTSADTATLDLFALSGELAGSGYAVHVAGARHTRFEGGGGDDAATLLGTPAADALTLQPTSASLSGLGLVAEVVDVPSITVDMRGQGVGQQDTAAIHGSDDAGVMEELFARPHDAEFRAAGVFSHQITAFESLTAEPGAGPLDTAFLYDSTGADHLDTDPDQATLSATDGSYELIATGFPYVHGYATGGGFDTADMWDSSGNDSVYAYGDLVKMIGETSFYFRRAKYFDEVTAHAVNGVDPAEWGDAAYLRDSADDDEFTASPAQATMDYDVQYPGGVRQVMGPTVTVVDFDYVHGYALYGGVDTAFLHDSPGDDTATSTPWYTKLFNETDPANTFFLRAKYFEFVHAYADSGGHDVARMYDSSRRDTFYGSPASSRMVGVDYRYNNRVRFFDEVYARADAGGFDVAQLNDSPHKEHLDAALPRANPGHWAQVTSDAASPLDFLYYIEGFDRADAFSSNAEDEAHFDPAGEVADWLFTHDWF